MPATGTFSSPRVSGHAPKAAPIPVRQVHHRRLCDALVLYAFQKDEAAVSCIQHCAYPSSRARAGPPLGTPLPWGRAQTAASNLPDVILEKISSGGCG